MAFASKPAARPDDPIPTTSSLSHPERSSLTRASYSIRIHMQRRLVQIGHAVMKTEKITAVGHKQVGVTAVVMPARARRSEEVQLIWYPEVASTNRAKRYDMPIGVSG